MDQLKGTLSVLPTWMSSFLSNPTYVLIVLVLLLLVVLLVRFLRKRAESGSEAADGTESDTSIPYGVPSEEGARMAAAIAASIVVMEDQALVAAITAAVRVYLEEENGGKPLESGFRVVSFKRRSTGRWNR